MPKWKKSLEQKRHDFRESVRGYFEAKRKSHESYTDLALAAVIVKDKWDEAKPVAKMLVTEKIADWLGGMARAATEETLLTDQLEVPGVILYDDGKGSARRRKSIRSATLWEVRSYASILEANANGAMAEVGKVRAMIARAEESGCGEDEEIWPHLSDEPRLPFGSRLGGPTPEGSSPSPEA